MALIFLNPVSGFADEIHTLFKYRDLALLIVGIKYLIVYQTEFILLAI